MIEEHLRDYVKENGPLSIYVVDSNAQVMSELMESILHMHEVEANFSIYENQREGVDAINGHINTIVLSGIFGNGLDSGASKIETPIGYLNSEVKPWAQYTPAEINRTIKGKNSNAKIIAFTGGNYNAIKARQDGADGYLFKGDMFMDTLIPTLVKTIQGNYWDSQ